MAEVEKVVNSVLRVPISYSNTGCKGSLLSYCSMIIEGLAVYKYFYQFLYPSEFLLTNALLIQKPFLLLGELRGPLRNYLSFLWGE